MMQVPVAQAPQYQPVTPPNYNAVKIDINNPQVSTPNYSQMPQQAPVYTAPMYDYPQAQVYEMPIQSVYNQPQNYATPPVTQITQVAPPAPQVEPAVPQPVVVQPQTTPEAPAQAQTVDVKAPEKSTPKLDINEFISKLTSPDYEVQASSMEAIALLAQDSPQKATELLDVKVIDSLVNIMGKDSSKIEGPTPKQLQIREKIISGKKVSEAEMAEASKITPMEKAERNKMYAMYTVAILDKLYGSEIEKMDKTVVPLTELPGAANIVEQAKSNPNPMVRAAAIDALSYVGRPEYKQDLTTILTVAKNDKDANVKQAATVALDKLNKTA